MSKKMLKRSLALGALMAFVITGSAMAEELTINYDSNTGYVANGTNFSDSIVASNQESLFTGLSDVNVGWVSLTNNDTRYTIASSVISSGNIITIKDAELAGVDSKLVNVKGFVVAKGDTTGLATNNNMIIIDGSTISNQITAADNRGIGEAKNNIVIIKNNSTVGGNGNTSVYGAIVGQGNAEKNRVEIIDSQNNSNDTNYYGIVGAAVYSSYIESNAIIKNNEVYVENSKVEGMIWGAVSNQGNAEGNSVVITNSSICNGEIFGANTLDGIALNNEVMVTASTINKPIYGGVSEAGSDVIGNKITINSGEINSEATILGGYSAVKDPNEFPDKTPGKADVNKNEVIINGGTVKSNVYGGMSGVAIANENIVTITGGVVTNKVYGGYGVTEANNNTINISGDADVSGASLYGSNKEDSTGNTLNIAADWANSNVKSINNFNEINIEEAQWGEAVVNVTGTLALNDTVVNVDTVRVAGDDDTFAPNGTSTLIAAGSITGDVSSESSVNIFKGVATIYEATVKKSVDEKTIEIQLGGEDTATYNAGEMNPQVLVIGESRAAATAFANQGSELIETGLDALARDNATDTKAFAAVYGNTSEFATGSEVKVNGWSGIVGVGKTNANGLTVGAFFENGEGNYRTYNNVNNEFMRGDGEACYNGGGFIVRKDNVDGVYTEASLRAGNLQNELRNAVRGSEGLTGYDIDTFYYGAHVGIGKVIPRGNEGDSIDVYGKFIYTHHDSEDFTIDGDQFHFDSVDSERLRLGFRINEAQTNKLSMYYGAAWEYEFGGDADNTVVGYDLSTPSLGGSTVIGEVGMHYNASEKWSLDFNARAYSGQRDGFSGSVQANYSF